MISASAKRRLKKLLLWSEIMFILVLGAGMGVVLGAFYQINKLLPEDAVLEAYRAPVGTKIFSSDGVLLAKLAAENREPVSLDVIPQHMQDAIVSIEDSRFYRHSGLDYRGLTRALWANVTGRELAQGGSTLTQQLARNMFLSSRKTVSRKVKEILLAVQIERNWTKRRILEEYLNHVYLGSGAYGVKSAAKVYFNKDVSDITLEEAAMLAALPQRPSELNPYIAFRDTGTYDRTKFRRDTVLRRMAELGFVTDEEAQEAIEKPIKVSKERPQGIGYFRAKYFVQHVVDELRNELKYDQDIIDKAGLTVITSLNWKMQQEAERVTKEKLAQFKSRRVGDIALVTMDPHTGYIRAMVGGANDPWEKYQFNVATQGRRQPGSSFKAFVYAAAFEQGHRPGNSVQGAVIPITMPDGSVYRPKNLGSYGGSMSYTDAFKRSVNGAAVNVAVKVGPKQVAEVAHRLGLQGNLRAYPSIALGASEATPLEMANAFGVFAAGGNRARPMSILQVRDQEGKTILDLRPQITPNVVKPETVEYMNVLTRAVVTSGTAAGAVGNKVPNAHGKTGTSEKYADAWFVGYTPDLVTAVWAGNRDNKPMGNRVFGGTIAAPIWSEFMQKAVALNPARKARPALQEARQPAPRRPVARTVPITADGNERSQVRVTVCEESGLLAISACPVSETQTFMLGEQPMVRCDIHTGDAPVRKPDPATEDTPAEEPESDNQQEEQQE
jgi:penicillin-binding protein 1A